MADQRSERFRNILNKIKLVKLKTSPGAGIHSVMNMLSAGFEYTGDGDTARCKDCGLEISNWTKDMIPFIIHSKQKPACSFVQSMIPSSSSNVPISSSLAQAIIGSMSTPNGQENPSKRIKIEPNDFISFSTNLNEPHVLIQVRRRTFSHWPHRTIPSSTQMIEAGFFNCNVGDRVICIYCNLICQQWIRHTDDPCEVHKTLSHDCPYVKAKLMRPVAASTINANENLTGASSASYLIPSIEQDLVQSNEIVSTAPSPPAYAEEEKRHASFATWPNKNLPSKDDLVRAGFFYTGTNTTVTCFYCNGSLQNWGPNDNPMIEHARWFPHCAHAKQLCGDELYRKIQESKRAQQERAKAKEEKENTDSGTTVNTNTNTTRNNRQLLIPDESTLSRLVATRLDLPISQRLLDQNFKLSIIIRCWEDQLRLKQDDFVSECDLYIACLILQKQIEHIDGKKENIVIPSTKMKQIREQEKQEQIRTNFTEEKEKTIQRERSICGWPLLSPSPINMVSAGWSHDSTKGKHYTICIHCRLEYHNWQPEDNPLTIHQQLSPSCPFILAKHRMHPTVASIKSLGELLTQDKIASEAAQPVSNVILISDSSYAEPPKRAESYSTFLGGPPENAEELVSSGFYYRGMSTLVQCYNCGGAANDLHQYSSKEINSEHRKRFPHCRLAQSLPQQDEVRSINHANLCKWCLVNPNELVIYPCMHLAICYACTQLIHTCPICGIETEYFFRLFK